MTLFLTSSPFVENAEGPILSNANGFIDRIREALPPFPRCLFVAADPERRDLCCQFGTDVVTAFSREGILFSAFQVLDSWNGAEAPALLENADFLVLAGGHVPTQNDFLRETGLAESLKGWEGVVMGISAGSMNCAEYVYVQPEEPGESAPDFPRWAQGLGLTGVNILPHYQKVRNNILDGLRLFEDITYADSFGNCFFALVDGSYVYQDPERLLLFGEGYVLRDGILKPLTREGEVFDLSCL